ncbi:fluoride efflux transporter FluC [Phytohabitans rumicis]|uniref:Fluoride-specific ion channel FluC n=1 Tax=Phytohabitans rumicis TaxID=1076125 RepID=A0A6V8L708_9ACTN|nr:CrcB family protein [Phytohabitans rumicis]GFJ90611.1 putative fluoride ion transporter CrcB [Phytohabitans rumicis]
MTLVLVLIGGAFGAVARHLAGHLLRDRVLPWGTFLVNVAGSALLGLLAGFSTILPGWVGSLVGVGFCGALTTYSTFGLETVRLPRRYAILNVALTLAAGFGAAALGWQLAQLA